ncbi:hypothetical protein D3C75_1139500 [compost metagenome]
MHPRLQALAVGYRLLGVAGDEQYLQAWAQGARGIGHLATIEPARQADIGDQQVYRRIGLQHGQAGMPIRHLHDLELQFAEHVLDQHAQDRLIVDQQDPVAHACQGLDGVGFLVG